jgi:hypothetical protein
MAVQEGADQWLKRHIEQISALEGGVRGAYNAMKSK